MKPGLPIGAQHQENIRTDNSMQAKAPAVFGGKGIHPLLGTAPLIEALEWTSRQLILPYLEDDEEGVGAALEFRHLLPVPIGEHITLFSEVVEVSTHRVKTRIQAFHQNNLIADGMFSQGIVQKAQLLREPDPFTQSEIYLHNSENNYRFSVELLDWESKLTCTPYDEWLMCRVQLQSPLGVQTIEGPLLLRIDVESIYQALLGMLTQENSLPFESDFLDPTLKLTFHQQADGTIISGITFQANKAANDRIHLYGLPQDTEAYPISFPLDARCILPWCQMIQARLLELQELL